MIVSENLSSLRGGALATTWQSSLNMERDLKLFADYNSSDEEKPIIFFYTWDKPAITIGKIQRNREELIARAATLGINCYLRPTGGRAVLHGGDICYTFIGTQSDPEFGGKLGDSFKKVNAMMIDLVSTVIRSEAACPERSVGKQSSPTLNLASCLSTAKQSLEKTNCFSSTVCNEGLFNEHKIIGAAQAMGARAFIQQGSIQIKKINVGIPELENHKTLEELLNRNFDLKQLCMELNESVSSSVPSDDD